MTQSVTDKTPIPVTTWRRHNDPPGLWVAVVISSVILHLPLVWLLASSGLSMTGRKFSSRPIPIEYVTVLPSQQSKKKPIAVVPPKVQPKPKPVEVKPKTIITQPPVEKKEPSIAQATLPDAITFTNLDDIKKANLSPKVKKTPLNPPIKPKVASSKPLPPKQPTLNQEKQRQQKIAQLQRQDQIRRQNLIAQQQRQQDEQRRQNQIAQQQRQQDERRQNLIAQQQRQQDERRQNQIAQQQRQQDERRQNLIAQQQRQQDEQRRQNLIAQQQRQQDEQRRQNLIAQQRQQDEKKRKQLIAQLQQQDKLRRQQQIDEQRRQQEVANNQTEVKKSSTPVIVDAEPPLPPPGATTTEEGTGFLTASLFVKPQQVQQDLNSTPGNVLKIPPQLSQKTKTPNKLPLLDDKDKQRVTKSVKCGVLLSIDANGKIFSPKEGFSGIRANSDTPGMQDICQRYAEEYFQQNKGNIEFTPGQDIDGKLAAGQILTDITIQPAGAR